MQKSQDSKQLKNIPRPPTQTLNKNKIMLIEIRTIEKYVIEVDSDLTEEEAVEQAYEKLEGESPNARHKYHDDSTSEHSVIQD